MITSFLEQSNQDIQLVYQKLENALREIKELRAENRAIKEAGELRPGNRINKLTNASQHQNVHNVEAGFDTKDDRQQYPVLRKPIDPRLNSTDLYSKQHEVSTCNA
jgi:hypothetical protein